MTENERADELRSLGVKWVVFLNFTQSIQRLDAESFFRQILVLELNAQVVVVGPTHRFGHKGAGNISSLKYYASRSDATAVVAPECSSAGSPISSSRIRKLLIKGKVEEASELLGRPYRLSGTVVTGSGAGGAVLGYPTANLDPQPKSRLIPQNGVYECIAHVNGKASRAVVNIGTAPSMDRRGKEQLRIEAHLLNRRENLYGRALSVDFVVRLRDEQYFSDVDDLRQQIALDVGRVRGALRFCSRDSEEGITAGNDDPSPSR